MPGMLNCHGYQIARPVQVDIDILIYFLGLRNVAVQNSINAVSVSEKYLIFIFCLS